MKRMSILAATWDAPAAAAIGSAWLRQAAGNWNVTKGMCCESNDPARLNGSRTLMVSLRLGCPRTKSRRQSCNSSAPRSQYSHFLSVDIRAEVDTAHW